MPKDLSDFKALLEEQHNGDNKSKSVKEMMEKIKKESETQKGSEEQFDAEELYAHEFEYPEFEEEAYTPPKEAPTYTKDDIKEKVQQFVEKTNSLHLNDKGQQIVSDFLTFQLQRKYVLHDIPEINKTHFNLLIRSDDFYRTSMLVEEFQKSLSISSFAVYSSSESDFKKLFSEYHSKKSSGKINSTFPIFSCRYKILFIYNCEPVPEFDPDLPTGLAIEASRKNHEIYITMWNEIFKHIKENPDTILITHADEFTFRGSLKKNSELFYRVCSHHLYLDAPSEEELFQDCMLELKKSSFELCPDFENQLHEYFITVYPKAELRSKAFVDDLLKRIYALYFSKCRDSKVLSLDCIPNYYSSILSAEEILGQIDNLVGLEAVKKAFHDIYAMQYSGLAAQGKQGYHMMFVGNPGTGKTMVAKMSADLFYRMGIIKSNKLIVAKIPDLISQWQGGSGLKTSDLVRRAKDGVLFIDEAYGLASNPRGSEALNQLIQEMEDHIEHLIVIFAGYKEEMRDLLKLNPGLSSRIRYEIEFEDYSLEELVKIFHSSCMKEGFAIHPSAEEMLEDCISARMSHEFFGNAREVKTILQNLKEAWSTELYEKQTSGDDSSNLIKVFYPKHFEKILPPRNDLSINDLIGLGTLKSKLESFKKQVLYQKVLKEKGVALSSISSMHMIFTGNPGTGKTTVAKLIADDLYSIGVLKTNRLVEAGRLDLISSIQGQTAIKTADVIKKAIGGVLFIDEAYALAGNALGREVIEVMLTAMEEHKNDTIFIFAGYYEEMQDFLAINPGIQSRISYYFHFNDYTPDELTEICEDKLITSGFTISDNALEKVKEIMEYFQSVKNFGNGRFVNHLIQQIIAQRANRSFSEKYRDITVKDIPEIKTLIETAPSGMKLYDPSEISDEDMLRTAVHEVGHAFAILETNPKTIPKEISVTSQSGSYGRVLLSAAAGHLTDKDLLNTIIISLSGKNAERAIFESHSTGCSSDFLRAKQIASEMLETYAMFSYGHSIDDILLYGDQCSMEIIEKHKDKLLTVANVLIQRKRLTGEEFLKLLNNQDI